MTAAMASAGSTSFSFSSTSRYSFDVFLSFRGEDTRKTFTDHLRKALDQAGIDTFLDDDSIPRGENIESVIPSAIKSSKVAVIVFSRDFASSRWCLDELALMMDCTSVGLIVIPVFYHVDPSDVGKQRGEYGKAFAAHKKKFEPERVQKWRGALERVAKMAGMVLRDRHESSFIEDIVKKVGNILNRKVLYVPSYVVGIDGYVKKVTTWLRDESPDSKVMIICGAGGIGKTTIAKIVYNQRYRSFKGSSFLLDISRETATEDSTGLRRLQKQLLSDIKRRDSDDISNVDAGFQKIQDAISKEKVLIVLDDVDSTGGTGSRIIEILPKWLSPGSKMIITTRNEGLQRSLKGPMLKAELLKTEQSLQLLSLHAFGQDYPPKGYVEQTEMAVSYCGGLPLALQVVGSTLRGKTVDMWKSELQELLQLPHPHIQGILRLSYNSLQNDRRQNLFLNIVCFFMGMDKDFVATITNGCDGQTGAGIEELIDKCLITVDEENRLTTHKLLIEMGKEIVRDESHDFPWRRSRLWDGDAFRVLNEDRGTESIRCLELKLPMVNHNNQERSLRTSAFTKMDCLELLKLHYVNLEGNYKDFPKSLIWLFWLGFAMDSIPADFPMENLVVLDIQNSSLKHVWEEFRYVPNLKILNLSHSHFLVSTPKFNGLPHLEKLILEDCVELVEIDESIESLKRLILLNLKDCKKLKKIPRSIASLRSLQELDVSGCSQLDASNSSSLPTAFSFTCLPHSLVRLNLSNCNLSDDHIPGDLSFLPALQHLDLSLNPIYSLAESIKSLTLLQTLNLENCKSLQFVPVLPDGLLNLNLDGCKSLERIGKLPRSLENAAFYRYCLENLVQFEELYKLQEVNNAAIDVNNLHTPISETFLSIEALKDRSLVSTSIVTPTQEQHECNMFSSFLLGNDIPDWYNYKVEGSSFSFYVPYVPDQKINGLNFCAVYVLDESMTMDPNNKGGFPEVCIENRATGFRWTDNPPFVEISGADEDKRWFSPLTLWFQLEAGEQMRINVKSSTYKVKKFGIHLLYEQQYVGSTSVSTSTWYQSLTDKFPQLTWFSLS